jgi:hypothetical protein
MRHAGCALPAPGGGRLDPAPSGAAALIDPSNPASWTLDESSGDGESSGRHEPARIARPTTAAPASTAPAVWIEIDNSHCARPSHLVIDGRSYGQIPGRRRTSVRTHAGPHEICVLPTSEKRECGDPGTLRQAYFYEGWSLVVRCDR